MTPVLILMAIAFHLQIISGIVNSYGIVTVRVQRGERVILKCLSSGVMRSWLGPDVSNFTNIHTLIYFSNYLKNPKLNMSKYSVEAKNGNYDLTILNFQEVDTGLYICRCFSDHDNGTFNETKYTVSLLGIVNSYGIVTVRVQRGERVILKCLSSGVMRSWLGPDVSNFRNEHTLIYFSNYLKNPKLNMSKYSVEAKNGNYDLTILNFQKVDTGLYICRCFSDHDNGTFNETKYTVSLLGIVKSHGIVTVRVQRGERVILKCLSSGVMRSWLGPDVSNFRNEHTLIYFSNYLKNPKLIMSKYSVEAKNGNYDLTILNFQKVDTGLYICRCFSDHDNGTFNETKYTVSLLGTQNLGRAPVIQVNVKEASYQLPANQRHSKTSYKLTIILVVVFLLGISLTILGFIARRKWGSLEQPDVIDELTEDSDDLNYAEVLTESLTS